MPALDDLMQLLGGDPVRSAFDETLRQYPILGRYGVTGAQSERPMMESWPANEPGGPGWPRPAQIPMDRFGVEYRQQDRPLDILGDATSHYLTQADPVVGDYYRNFTGSLDDSQRQRLAEQYRHAVGEGETRPYAQWEERSGLPAYFRGYPFQQWPDDFNARAYTDRQRSSLDRMMEYLRR